MRMKRICWAFLLFFIFGNAAFAEDMHIHVYGGSGKDTLMDVIALRDGGFLLVGSTLSNDGDLSTRRWNTSKENCDAWAIGLDRLHNIRFQILMGQSNDANEQFIKAMPLPDGSTALLYEYIDEESHFYELQRWSDSGLYLETIPIPPSTVMIHGLEDSFLFAGGFREYFDPDATEGPWLARYAFDGTPIWAGTYPDLSPWAMLDAKQNGKHLLCSGIWRETFSDYSGNILCMDIETGEVLWNYTTEPKGYARLSRLTMLSDGSAIAVGWKSGLMDRDGGLVVRVDQDGTQLSKRTIYEPDEPDSAWFTDVLEVTEGVMIVGERMFGDDPLYTAGWLLLLNDRGSSEGKYGRDSLLNLKGGRLVRGMDGLTYYFGFGGTNLEADDFFMLRLDNPPNGLGPLDEFDGMGEYE